MTHMAKLARLSAESMSDMGLLHPEYIQRKGAQVHDELTSWWSTCPPQLRDQRTDWRRQYRPRKLTVAETLEEEAFSSTKSCMQGCIIYLNHVLDPLGQNPQPQEVKDAIYEILEIAKETPGGYGLEMGLYWGLFMAGVAIFNDEAAEDLIRQKLKADKSISIYVSISHFLNCGYKLMITACRSTSQSSRGSLEKTTSIWHQIRLASSPNPDGNPNVSADDWIR